MDGPSRVMSKGDEIAMLKARLRDVMVADAAITKARDRRREETARHDEIQKAVRPLIARDNAAGNSAPSTDTSKLLKEMAVSDETRRVLRAEIDREIKKFEPRFHADVAAVGAAFSAIIAEMIDMIAETAVIAVDVDNFCSRNGIATPNWANRGTRIHGLAVEARRSLRG